MNNRERQLYQLIKKNPYVTQQELAAALNLSRPSIANLISGLVKQGYIRGKAYILNEPKQIVCIGGANVDRKFYLKNKLQLGTSNPIHSAQNPGGVARNIAENLGRLGLDVNLLTAGGADKDWDYIEEMSNPYMNLSDVTQFSEVSTGSYTAVLDEAGDLVVGLADMEVFDLMTPEWLRTYTTVLTQARCILADLNCPKPTLEYLYQFAKSQDIALFFVTVSVPKMSHLPDQMDGLTWLITNLDETKGYFNQELTMEEAVEKWLDQGVMHVVITNGENGAAIGDKQNGVNHVAAASIEEIADVTGAGDAFSAAVAYAWAEGEDAITSAKAGIANASKTLQTPYTVRQDLSASQLKKDMEELS